MGQYDVIISGKLLDAVTPELAKEQLAKVFNMPAERAAALVDGKPHRIKKAVDEPTARKFKAALTKAGLQTLIRPNESMAETTAETGSENNPAPAQNAPTSQSESLDLAPPGTPVLREDERTEVKPAAVDTSGLSLDEMAPWSGTGEPAPEPIPAPDFGLAPPGAEIETLPDKREKLNPDISKLDIDEPGATLGAPAKQPPPAPDTSHIKLEKHNPFL